MTVRQVVTKRTDVLTFGKHKGKTIAAVLKDEPSYILWLDAEEIVEFPDDVLSDARQGALYGDIGPIDFDVLEAPR